jgi:glucokinase
VSQLAIGVDIGGTNMRAALVDPDGAVVSHARRRVELGGSAARCAAEIVELAQIVAADVGLTAIGGIGVGIPGWTNRLSGELVLAPKFSRLNSRELCDGLREKLPCPVYFDSDPHMATLGELWVGAGRNADNFVMITLGTGIGCGIVIGGQLYTGHHGFAPEFGHMIVGEASEIPCACGVPGCLESLASGPAIGHAGQQAAREGRGQLLVEWSGGNAEAISAETVVACARNGDPTALVILQRAGRLIGAACANVVSLLEPERVVVGGGLSDLGELLLGPIRETMQRQSYLIAQGYACPELVKAQLGDRAGVVGAARLAYNHMD